MGVSQTLGWLLNQLVKQPLSLIGCHLVFQDKGNKNYGCVHLSITSTELCNGHNEEHIVDSLGLYVCLVQQKSTSSQVSTVEPQQMKIDSLEHQDFEQFLSYQRFGASCLLPTSVTPQSILCLQLFFLSEKDEIIPQKHLPQANPFLGMGKGRL